MSYFSSDELHFFNEGTALRIHERFGAHLGELDGVAGTHFAVWAPGARSVRVVGDFSHWGDGGITMHPVQETGIWYGFGAGITTGALYKYRVESQDGRCVDKADPVGFAHEEPPKTASVVTDLDYQWNDSGWMASRKERIALDAPVRVYEVHLGSWRRTGDGEMLSYREIAPLISCS